MVLGLVWGKAEGLQGKNQTSADLSRLSGSSPGGLPQGPAVSLLLTPPALGSGALETYLCPIVGLSW